MSYHDGYFPLRCENEEQWLRVRQRYVGASEAAAALGLSPYLSRYALWARKTGRAAPDDTNERMLWGRELEPVIAREYARRMGVTLGDPGRFTFMVKKGSHLGCTVDRFILGPCDSSFSVPDDPTHAACVCAGSKLLPRAVLEIKNLAILPESEWEDGGPLIYRIQVQAQMFVTDLPRGVLCPLVGGHRMRPMDNARDQEFIDSMVEGVEEFWWFVKNDVPPPLDGHETTHDALQDIRRARKPLKEVKLPPEAAVLAFQYDQAKAKLEEAEKLLEITKAEVKDLLLREGGEVGKLADGTAFRWSPIQVRASTCPKCGHVTRQPHEREGFSRIEAK